MAGFFDKWEDLHGDDFREEIKKMKPKTDYDYLRCRMIESSKFYRYKLKKPVDYLNGETPSKSNETSFC